MDSGRRWNRHRTLPAQQGCEEQLVFNRGGRLSIIRLGSSLPVAPERPQVGRRSRDRPEHSHDTERHLHSDPLSTPQSSAPTMTFSIQELGTLDRVIHEPARLMVMAMLYAI